MQAIPNDRIADLVSSAFQFHTQLPQAERRPQLPPHRVTSRRRFEQRLKVGKERWILGYPRFTSAALAAYPVISNRGAILEIFKPSIYCPPSQPRRLSHRAHTAVSD